MGIIVVECWTKEKKNPEFYRIEKIS